MCTIILLKTNIFTVNLYPEKLIGFCKKLGPLQPVVNPYQVQGVIVSAA